MIKKLSFKTGNLVFNLIQRQVTGLKVKKSELRVTTGFQVEGLRAAR